ncbi:nuclear transport factor 2 family protein [bacterium]|nr:nuclear transport factor 2 family protein [FCB group bacterium]MBL7191375.1 nuclear transport factor 2 family protein [bacterium]
MKTFNLLVSGGLILIVSALLMTSCQREVDIESAKKEIAETLDKYNSVFEHSPRDIEALLQFLTDDPQPVIIGSTEAERFIGKAPLREAFEKAKDEAKEMSFKIISKDRIINIAETGNVAWYSEMQDIVIYMPHDTLNIQGGRATGVLVKQDGKWLIVQGHYSFPEKMEQL